MPRKNKPWNPFDVLRACLHRCKMVWNAKKMMWNVKIVTQNTSLYIFSFSHFGSISCYFAIPSILQMISWNIRQKARNLYTHCFSFRFRVMLMPWKNKLWNWSTFRKNADQCKIQQNVKNMTENAKENDAKYPATCFSFFAFCEHFMLFRDKCIASIRIDASWRSLCS